MAGPRSNRYAQTVFELGPARRRSTKTRFILLLLAVLNIWLYMYPLFRGCSLLLPYGRPALRLLILAGELSGKLSNAYRSQIHTSKEILKSHVWVSEVQSISGEMTITCGIYIVL